VVPVYNREHYLAAALDSVRAQTLRAWELVVHDDGSSDGSVAVAERYAAADSRISVSGGPNGGVASARNNGFAATDRRTEFVIFLDSDDMWEPDALDALVAALDAHPEFSSAQSIARCIDAEGEPLPDDDLEERARRRMGYRAGRLVPVGLDEPTTFAEMVVHNWVMTPGTHLVRRRVMEQVGPFDVATDPADDWDMAIRISRFGDIGFVNRSLLLWRRHGNTLTNTSPRWRQAYFTVRQQMLSHPANTPEQTRLARLSFQGANRAALEEAWGSLTNGRFKEAVRGAAKALQQYALYLRADVPTRLRHSLRTPGGVATRPAAGVSGS
jgi:glycosyltransferase involved in cell wall biosynthesis